MGVPAGAGVILAGHSLGGMVAQNLPVLPELGYMQRWRTLRVITFGSPIMNQLRVDRDARRFAVRGDQVVLLVSYWVARFGYREMFYPPDISGLSKKPIWVDGGRVVDPSGIALHGAYGQSFDLQNYDALGDQGSQILQIDASRMGQFGRELGGADAEACPESRQWALSLLPRPPMRDKIGIPDNGVRRGDLIYGLYNRSRGITLPDWAEQTNTRTVQLYLTEEDYRVVWQNRARYDIEYAYGFDKAARERVQTHFDLNELSIRKALGAGNGDTDRELRWLRRWWRDFERSPVKPKFWCGGRQAKPPWQWANPDRAEYL
jgi:hypothetical protein